MVQIGDGRITFRHSHSQSSRVLLPALSSPGIIFLGEVKNHPVAKNHSSGFGANTSFFVVTISCRMTSLNCKESEGLLIEPP
jgi:hypothetical protein